MDGTVFGWFDNSHKKAKGVYKYGVPNAVLTMWYETGQKKSDVVWYHGKLNGLATEWDNNGHVISKIYFK